MKEQILDEIREYWQNKAQPKPFIPGKTIVPVSGAVIDEQDISSVADALLDGWFTEWIYASKFSKRLAEYVGVKHAILCNSGSSASLLATLACIEKFGRNKRRYKVVTCATGFPTTVAPIVQFGYMPLFVDVDLRTLNIDEDGVLECLDQPDVAGIVVAHTLGFPIEDVAAIRAICDATGKFFVEDVADAFGGSHYSFGKLGSYGNTSFTSFFPSHQLTSGEGGAVFTDDDELAEIVRCYCEWGRDCTCKPGQDNTCGKRFDHTWTNLPTRYDHKYTYTRLGYNLKMTELQAALGYSQLFKVDEFAQQRRENYQYLYDRLHYLKSEGVMHFVEPSKYASPFGFPITVDTDLIHKDELVSFLEGRNIRTRPVFAGNLTRQPAFDNIYYENHTKLINSDYVMNNTFWLGCAPCLTKEMLEYVADSVDEYVKDRG
jgi:CDP-6-deoxy-D-xylo-4-hexulose-3-dehydrase